MDRDDSGKITRLCIDEIGTDSEKPYSCTEPNSGAREVKSGFGKLGEKFVTLMRADATLVLEGWSAGSTRYFACTPSKNADAVRKYLVDSKAEQKSSNVF